MRVRYIGSGLALLTLAMLAFAGQIDNSATRPYVDAKVAAGVAEAVGAIPTSSVAYAASAGTAANASNLGGVAAASYVTNGGATINGQAISNNAAITVTASGGSKAILRQGTNYAFAATTATFLPAANIVITQAQTWVSAGVAASNTVCQLDSGGYLVSIGTRLAGSYAPGVDGRVFCQAVVGAATNQFAYIRFQESTLQVPILSLSMPYHYVTSSVPFGLQINYFMSHVTTNDASTWTCVIERQ